MEKKNDFFLLMILNNKLKEVEEQNQSTLKKLKSSPEHVRSKMNEFDIEKKIQKVLISCWTLYNHIY